MLKMILYKAKKKKNEVTYLMMGEIQYISFECKYSAFPSSAMRQTQELNLMTVAKNKGNVERKENKENACTCGCVRWLTKKRLI